MNYIAWQMLTGDRAKYFALVFTIAFASFLLVQQVSIFVGILERTASQIVDVAEPDLWVMDPATRYFDEVQALKASDLYRVRGVAGVEWAVALYKGNARMRAADGSFRQVILLGLDDATLTGVPRRMLLGSAEALREPDAVILDRAGYLFFFPGEPLVLGREFELNDRRARLVGIAEASAPFVTFPVVFTRYSNAVTYIGRERNTLSFVLAKAAAGVPVTELAARIGAQTGLAAQSVDGFRRQTIGFYLANTGIPVNFGITIVLAVLIGMVVAGQTFYLFTLENLQQYGVLKAIGVSDGRIVAMILLQACVVGLIGYGLGMGLVAAFFEVMLGYLPVRGIVVQPVAALVTGVVVLAIVALASLLSVRRVLVLEPAAVFRG